MDPFLDALDPDPRAQFELWFAEAQASGLHEPESTALATSTPDGSPSVRMVLLRRRDIRGLCFFTNLESRKAVELETNPRAALLLYWPPPLERQVRVEGSVEQLTEAEAFDYFRTRARESRLGAWASPQSRPVKDRVKLDERLGAVEARFAGEEEVPLPPFWGGYRVVPEAWEFWQGRPGRLHDRARYERVGLEAEWSRVRLGP